MDREAFAKDFRRVDGYTITKISLGGKENPQIKDFRR
jgi:hypothetical protein